MSNHEDKPEYVETTRIYHTPSTSKSKDVLEREALEGEPIHVGPRDSHMWHHNEPSKPTVNVQVEKNSRGTNWSVTVVGAESVAQALTILDKARDEMAHRFEGTGV